MPISIESSFQHVAWAEKKFFVQLAEVPLDLYAATYGNPEWNVANIATHIANGAARYEYHLTGVDHETPPVPRTREEMIALGHFLAARTAALLPQTRLDDELLQLVSHGLEFEEWRSTLLVQAIHHSVEHRAQIASALEANGYHGLNLDSIDAWAFAAATR